MKIGYARVSTREQNLDLQIDALKAAGYAEIFTEKLSGTKKNRPELERMLTYIRKGDTLVIWKLDRLGRSISDLINIVNKLKLLKKGSSVWIKKACSLAWRNNLQ